MSLSAKMRRAPMRAVSGAFIVNSGVGKLGADEAVAKQLHGVASGTYGFLGKVDPKLFAKALGAGEIALGGALLLPIVPPFVAGAALAGFSGALLNMYWNTPGMHEEGSPRPTQQGTGVAKDVFMLGMGVGLMADSVLEPAHDKKVEIASTVAERRHGKAARKARKEAKQARAEVRAHALEVTRATQADLTKKASKALDKAQKKARKSDALKKAQHASDVAAKRLAGMRDEYAPVVAEKAKNLRGAALDARDEYAPVVAARAKQLREAALDARDEYAPVVAEKAKTLRDAAIDARDEYAPVVAERAKTLRDAALDARDEYAPVVAKRAKHLRDAAIDARDEYGPLAAERARQARYAAREASLRFVDATADAAATAKGKAQKAVR